MFELDRVAAKITAVTNVSEKHGDDRVSGKSVRVKLTLPNTTLNDLLPGMREAFYRAPARREGALDLPDNNLCEKRFPDIGTIPYAYEGEGWIAKFIIGATGDLDVWITPAKISKISITMLEGGSVEYAFNVYGRLNETIQHGILDEQVQSECDLTLEKPQAQVEPALFEGQTPALDQHAAQRAALDAHFGPSDPDDEIGNDDSDA